MSSEWPAVSLDELTDGTSITYGVVKPGDVCDGGVKFIRGGDLVAGQILTSQLRTITPAVSQQYSRTLLRGGELLVSLVGNPGEVAIVPSTLQGANIARQVGLIRVDANIANANYIQYFLRSKTGRDVLLAYSKGSVQQVINLKDLKSVKVPLPSIDVQRSVADFMQALDDRITLLRETNATLEAIAQALFKSWFVDFDPVRAKMQGRTPEGMDEATAALFPDGLEESALGLVPRGWRVQSFRETIQIIGGGTPKTSNPDFWGGYIPWFSVVDAPDISDVFVVDTEKHITQAGLDGSSTKLLPTGTTIISARGTVGRLALTGRPMTMNQSCYGLRGLAGDSYFTYFSTKRLVEQLKQRAHGSVFDTITQESFAGVLVCFPIKSEIAAFEDSVESLMLRIRENLLQAQTLATLRDTLLPRLISGALRLPQAESAMEAV